MGAFRGLRDLRRTFQARVQRDPANLSDSSSKGVTREGRRRRETGGRGQASALGMADGGEGERKARGKERRRQAGEKTKAGTAARPGSAHQKRSSERRGMDGMMGRRATKGGGAGPLWDGWENADRPPGAGMNAGPGVAGVAALSDRHAARGRAVLVPHP